MDNTQCGSNCTRDIPATSGWVTSGYCQTADYKIPEFEQTTTSASKSLNGLYPFNISGRCPNCGYCPHCGRTDNYQPYYPSYQWYGSTSTGPLPNTVYANEMSLGARNAIDDLGNAIANMLDKN